MRRGRDIDAGSGFRCRELMLEREHHVSERTASHTMQVGDAFFGQLVSCAGLTLMEAAGPYMIPPGHWIDVLDLKERSSALDHLPTTGSSTNARTSCPSVAAVWPVDGAGSLAAAH